MANTLKENNPLSNCTFENLVDEFTMKMFFLTMIWWWWTKMYSLWTGH